MKRYGLIGLVAALLALLDQISKHLVAGALPLGHSRTVIDGFFNLVQVRNYGAAFGFLNRSDTDWQFWFFALVTLAAVGVLLYMAKTAPAGSRSLFAFIGLILGGALGRPHFP